LTLFSAFTFYQLIPYQFLNNNWDQKFDNIIYYFTYSKVWEFLDTFLILLRGKDTIFLHEFHHAGAFLCWKIGYDLKCNSIYLPTIFNSFVHSIMYFYYLLSAFEIRWIARIKPIITLIQMTQLTLGNFIFLSYGLQFKIQPCLIADILFVTYVFILIFLFAQFFDKNYIRKRNE
jgi:hypothetical protein